MIRWNGHATQEGTLDFSKGETQGFTAAEGHFRKHSVLVSKDGLTTDLTLSSIGIGTYLGDADDATDELVENAIVRSVADGCNVIDTAAVYRMGRGEKSVGRALRALRLTGGAYRDHLFISTKAGYAPTPAMVEELQACGLITADDIKPMGTGGVIGCLHPAFIEHSLENSLAALQLGTVDILYLHNPAESFLEMLGLEKFMQRLEAAFQACERAREDGKIMAYGLATWECFRAHPDKEGVHLSLEAVVKLAEKVGGPNHGCR